MIGVAPDYRGRGLSKPLLVAGMRYLLSAGVSEIGLHVDGANTPAIRLYQSVGFQKIGELNWFEIKLRSS
jgi:mycothiol synthase